MSNISTKYEVPRVLSYILIAGGWLMVAIGFLMLLVSFSGIGIEFAPPFWRQMIAIDIVMSIAVILSGLSTIVMFYVGLAVFDFADIKREAYLAEFGLRDRNDRNTVRNMPVLTSVEYPRNADKTPTRNTPALR